MTGPARRWELSESERDELRAESGGVGPVQLLTILARNPGLVPELLGSLLRGLVAAVRDSPALPSLLHAAKVRRIAPDAATGAGWHGADDFIAMAEPWLGPAVDALEIGCGAGRIADRVAARVHSLVCMDLSRTMLREARRNLSGRENVTVIRADATRLDPLGDESFDLLLAHDVFVTLDPNPVLAMLLAGARVLRPGGVVVASFVTIDRPEWLASQVEETREMAASGRFGGSHPRPYVGAQIDAWFEAAGLTVVKTDYERPARPTDRPHYMVAAERSDL